MYPPIAKRRAHSLGGLAADRRREVHEELPLAILGTSWTKGEPQEVKALMGVFGRPELILAIDDLRLHRMGLQSARSQALLNLLPDEACLCLRLAVEHHIIRITLERDMRILLRHPRIENMMQE